MKRGNVQIITKKKAIKAAKSCAKISEKSWFIVYSESKKKYISQNCLSNKTDEHNVLKVNPSGIIKDIRTKPEPSHCNCCGKPENKENFTLAPEERKILNLCDECFEFHSK